MPRIEKSVFIKKGPEEVFAFCEGPKTMALWQGTLVSAEKLTDGPWQVGSRIRMLQKVMGRKMEVILEITEYDPPHKYCFRNHSQIPFEGCQRYTSQDGGTLLTLEIEAKPKGLARVMNGLLKRQLEKQTEKDLNRLKNLLEGGNEK